MDLPKVWTDALGEKGELANGEGEMLGVQKAVGARGDVVERKQAVASLQRGAGRPSGSKGDQSGGDSAQGSNPSCPICRIRSLDVQRLSDLARGWDLPGLADRKGRVQDMRGWVVCRSHFLPTEGRVEGAVTEGLDPSEG